MHERVVSLKPLLRSNFSGIIFWQGFVYIFCHYSLFLNLWWRLFDIGSTSITSVDYSWWAENCKTNEFEVVFSAPWTLGRFLLDFCHNTWNMVILFTWVQDSAGNRSYWLFHFSKTNSCAVILSHHFSMTSDPDCVWMFPFVPLKQAFISNKAMVFFLVFKGVMLY